MPRQTDRQFFANYDGNRIVLAGWLRIQDFRRVTALLHHVVFDLGYQDVILDFSQLDFTHAPPMLAIIAQCIKLRSEDVDFDVILPSKESLYRLFQNSNWAYLIDPEHQGPSTFSPQVHNPASQFTNSDDQGRLVNEVMDTILASLTSFTRDHLKALEWSLNEITDNVLVHAQAKCGGLVQCTAKKTVKNVEFVVADAGIGIATSLKAGNFSFSSDVDALARAIQQGVTRDKKVGQGNGLFGSYQICVKSDGNFSMHSNRATLYYAVSKGMHTRTETVPYTGSVVVCGIDYTKPLLLEEALRFDNRSHVPVDLIESKYETETDGTILLKIADETASFGNRLSGKIVRDKIKNLVRLSSATKVVLDFQGIGLISSSFADEAFGKLFEEVGAIDFISTFEFKNVDPTVKKLIDRAILQRLSTAQVV